MSTEHWALPNHVFDELVAELHQLAVERSQNPMFVAELSLKLRKYIRPISRASIADRAKAFATMPGDQVLSEAEIMLAITPILNRCSVGRYKSLDECRAARRMAEDIKVALRKRLKEKVEYT